MKSVILFLLPLLCIISCSGVRVAVNYDTEINFSDYETYTFAEPRQNKAGYQHFVTKSILLEIDPLLKEKGLEKTDYHRADLTVHYQLFRRTRSRQL